MSKAIFLSQCQLKKLRAIMSPSWSEKFEDIVSHLEYIRLVYLNVGDSPLWLITNQTDTGYTKNGTVLEYYGRTPEEALGNAYMGYKFKSSSYYNEAAPGGAVHIALSPEPSVVVNPQHHTKGFDIEVCKVANFKPVEIKIWNADNKKGELILIDDDYNTEHDDYNITKTETELCTVGIYNWGHIAYVKLGDNY